MASVARDSNDAHDRDRLVAFLCEVGEREAGAAGAGREFLHLRRHDVRDTRPWDPEECSAIASLLSPGAIAHLIYGLVIAERVLGVSGGGSVASVIWLFRLLRSRADNAEVQKVADWCLVRTTNSYVPFGRSNMGAKSSLEFDLMSFGKEVNYQEHLKRQEAEQAAAVQRRIDRKNAVSLRSRTHAAATLQRREWLRALGDSDPSRRLKLVLTESNRDVRWFPIEWADPPDECLRESQIDVLLGLRTRVAHIRKGPWASLRARIDRVLASHEPGTGGPD